MKMMLSAKDAMEKWIKEVPALTIMHLGACDIANGDISENQPRDDYKFKVKHFLKTWSKEASEKIEKHIYGNIATKEKMRAKIKNHKWLIVSIPDWGKENKKVRGTTPQTYNSEKKM